MNLKSFLIILVATLISTSSFAQTNLLNAKTPEDINQKTEAEIAYDNDEPLSYGYVNKRDVLWAKTVWEIIDLDERMNFPLYYPIDTNNIGPERRSLYDVLLKNIKNGRIPNIYTDSYFTEKRELADIEATLSRVDTTDAGIAQLNAGEALDAQYIDRRDITAADIEEYRVRGYWYVDKRLGELKYRLIGIAPVAPDVNFIDDENSTMVELFWVFFPEAREVLHEAKAFNRLNTSMPISFDHMLNSRRFSGVIYKEDNEYGDREVRDYINDNALMQLLESDRIKEVIRNIEIDLWNY
ncbi:gliding motility protein GldN [uncultured Planktosalinus sp.]|uniref:type IX secretion system ring protein PorN/GldN n=1 Tax=uncultured Planktosalinus sp. TaxID=1810935 RepID=UPI0030D78AC1